MRLALLLFMVGLVGCTHDDEAHQFGPDQSVAVDLSFPSIDLALKVDLASADLLPCPPTGVTESSACADVGQQCNYICTEGECTCYPNGWLCFSTPCP
jgi:hypothetical protein